MQQQVFSATSANIAATILHLRSLGWQITDKLVVGCHEVQVSKSHVEVMYDYHLIAQRPAQPAEEHACP